MSLRELREALMSEEKIAKIKARVIKRCVQVGDCWLYNGERNAGNYGVVRVGERTMTASRFMLCVATSTPFSHLASACHVRTCTASSCCNPNHLFWSDHQVNVELRDRERSLPRPWLWPRPYTGTEGLLAVAVPMFSIADVVGSKSALCRVLVSNN